jgi:hypothetical protein
MRQHLSHLFSLSESHNPSNQVEWFVLSPFLGGPKSAVTSKTSADSTAFFHRDLKIVWELYAKRLEETDGGHKVDLVQLVKGMMVGLGKAEAVCESCHPATSCVPATAHHGLDPSDPAYIDPELTAQEYPRLMWGGHYPKLQRLKQHYDPHNLFRSPQSVRVNG